MLVLGIHCLPSMLLVVSSKVVELSSRLEATNKSLAMVLRPPRTFSGLAVVVAVGSISHGARQTLGFWHAPSATFWFLAAQGAHLVCIFFSLSYMKSHIMQKS